MNLFIEFVLGEVEEIDRVLKLVETHNLDVDLVKIHQMLLARQFVAMATRELLMEEGIHCK